MLLGLRGLTEQLQAAGHRAETGRDPASTAGLLSQNALQSHGERDSRQHGSPRASRAESGGDCRRRGFGGWSGRVATVRVQPGPAHGGSGQTVGGAGLLQQSQKYAERNYRKEYSEDPVSHTQNKYVSILPHLVFFIL